jgi:hypothetical protein
MPIRNAEDRVSADEVATEVLAPAEQRLAQLRAQQGHAMARRDWAEARRLVLEIVAAERWVRTLAEYGDTLTSPKTAGSAPREAWSALGATLTREYDDALTAALAAPSAEAFARADAAFRALVTFRSDAHTATQDKAFHPAGTPRPPSAHAPLAEWARLRNPFAAREPVDRSRWASLM